MRIEHTLEIRATCPADDKPDVYTCIITTRRVIPVERILEVVEKLSATKQYQEQLTQELHRQLAARVETIGFHSGVQTRVIAG